MECFFTTDDGVKLSYNEEIRGEGCATLLFLHGWGGNQVSFTFTLASLKGDYRIITYDHRGFGNSDRPDAGYGVERLTRDLGQLMDFLQVENVVLVGWSMGGWVALEYMDTVRDPRVKGVVLIDINVKIISDETYTHGFYDGAYTARDALRDVTLISKELRLFAQEMPEKANMTLYDAPAREFFIDRVVAQNPKPYPLVAMWLALCEVDGRAALSRLNLPVLFCHGGTSTYCPPAARDLILELLPNGTLAEFPECSHFIPIERPEKFAEKVDKFTKQCVK